MANGRRTRANYGVDAPGLVRVLLYVGVLVLALVAVGALVGTPSTIVSVLVGVALVCFIEGGLLLYSSKVAKLRERVRIIDACQLQGAETLLDLGCGRGLLLVEAARRLPDGKAVGVDIWSTEDQSGNFADATLANARAEGVEGRVEIRDGDARKLPFEDACFDHVVSSMVLHNIRDADGRAKAIGEIDRVLRPGGRLVLVDMAKTEEYTSVLTATGWTDVARGGRVWRMFPPVRYVVATKPTA